MHKSQTMLWRISAVTLLVAIICSFFVAGQRIQVEQQYKTVHISANMTDVRAFANAKNVSVQDMLQTFKAHGVSQVLFKEISIGDLERSGEVEIVQGAALQQTPYFSMLSTEIPVNEADFYLIVYTERWRAQIEQHMLAKVPGSKVYSGIYDVIAVPTMIADSPAEQSTAKSNLTTIGVGFDDELMREAASAGLGVIPQVRSWKAVDEDAMRLLKESLRSVPNLALILFNDKELPGYPKDLRQLNDVLSDTDGEPLAPLGIIEFNDQKGINQLGVLMDKNVVRLHTVSNAEMSKYEGDSEDDKKRGLAEVLDRWELSVRERNMRALLVRFFDIDQPAVSFDENMAYLDTLQNNLTERGYRVDGESSSMQSVQHAPVVYFMIGLGVCAGFLMLLLSLGFRRLAVLGAVASVVIWAVLLMVSPEMARKLMALAAVIIFPTLSCIRILPCKEQTLWQGVLRLLLLCAVSFIGAILTVGLLSSVLFMLKLDQFVGVKIAHVIPIVVVPFVIYIWQSDRPLETIRAIGNRTLDYKWLLLFAVLGVALMIYVTRTGNEGGTISAQETLMRQFLTDVMGVRPRSKEFLIGYPLTLVFLMFAGQRRFFWVLSIPAVIGQVSLVNTYAHIHTPLLISLERSLNGLLLGLIVAVILVVMIKFVLAFFNRWLARYETKPVVDRLKKEG